MEFILATGNPHKAEEFNKLFDEKILKIVSAPSKLDVIEDGKTFFENALIKARAYYEKFKRPILADDSGITVEALPDELGIYSARFGGEGLSDKDRALLLLKKMEGEKNRAAYFTCVLCFYISESEIYYFEGRMNGSIAHIYRGQTGFGYDPVFIPTDLGGELTVAEDENWKNENSHRANASNLALKFFKGRA